MGVARLKRDIVPVEEWIGSEYYLGNEARSIYPYWRQRIIDFFKSGKNKFIFHGSYSLGKTHIANIILLRELYEISCFEDFPEAFGLSSSSKVMFAFISVSATKAKRSGISKLLRMYDQIPYFDELAPRNQETSSSLDLGFAEVVHGSRVGHLTGEDFYGVIFDEANFVHAAQGDEYLTAQTLFLEAEIRGKTRFSIAGRTYGLYGLLSSAQTETSFTEQQIKHAREIGDAYVVEAATYEVKPEAYSPVKFQVFLGYDEILPFIIDEATEDVKQVVAKSHGLTFEQFLSSQKDRVIDVPDDLRQFYRTDIEYALKTLSGKTVRGGSKYLKNPALLERAYQNSFLHNPLTVDIPTLSLMSDDVITDFIVESVLLANYEEGAKVYIHLDLSVSGDKTGFGASYKSESGAFRTMLMMSIHRQKEADEIDLSKVEDVIYYLCDLGMSIGFISYDQYASRYLSQNLKKRFGKERVDQVSMDKDDTHYLLFSYLLKKGLIESYRYAPFDTNIRELIHDRAACKVDHTEAFEKDVCDGTIGSISSAFRLEGITREEVAAFSVANDGFYQDIQQDRFYAELIGESAGDDGFYSSILSAMQ